MAGWAEQGSLPPSLGSVLTTTSLSNPNPPPHRETQLTFQAEAASLRQRRVMLHVLNIWGELSGSSCTGATGTRKAMCTQRMSSGLTKGLQSGWCASPHSAINFISINRNRLLQLRDNTVGRPSCSATACVHTASQHPWESWVPMTKYTPPTPPAPISPGPLGRNSRTVLFAGKTDTKMRANPRLFSRQEGLAQLSEQGSPTPTPGTEPAQPHSPNTVTILGNWL